MKLYELVSKTIKGENTGRTPIYGWVDANLSKEVTEEFGAVATFEDHYEFDAAHIFGSPNSLDGNAINKVTEC